MSNYTLFGFSDKPQGRLTSMKKILFVLLMMLTLVVIVPAQAAETTIAEFSFDTDPRTNYTFISDSN